MSDDLSVLSTEVVGKVNCTDDRIGGFGGAAQPRDSGIGVLEANMKR